MRSRALARTASVLFATAIALGLPLSGRAQLQRLNDAALSKVSGQSGITLEAQLNAAANSINYFDDGNGIALKGFKIGSASGASTGAQQRYNLDVGANGALNIGYTFKDNRIEFSDLTLSDNPTASAGGIFFDQDNTGTLTLKEGTDSATGLNGFLIDSTFSLTNGRLGYRTNGNEVFLDNMTLNVNAPGMFLGWNGSALDWKIPSLTGNFNIGAIRYSNNPLNHGNTNDVTTGNPLPSYGGLSGDFDLSAEFKLQGGGRFGSQGMTINGTATINNADLTYTDDTHPFTLQGITGNINLSDLRIDVAPDWNNRLGLALTLGQLDGTLNVANVEMGDANQSFGSLGLNFTFADQTVGTTNYTNALYVEGGGDPNAGSQGLLLATQWSLANADLSYVDDGNTVMFSGIKSWGKGDVTLGVTKAGTINNVDYYDGLRIGFNNVHGGYSIAGLKVGNATVGDAKNAHLQGGTELLLALGFYPSFDFDLNGQVTLGPGGQSGEGITINSDVYITNGHAALISDQNANGVWASDLSYDIHTRNTTLDMTSTGLAIVKGEAWSTMDIGNLRVGDKNTGASFGRVVLQTYETGSSMTITPGGAGTVCVGGTGTDATTCAASGGIWEDRGTQGVTIGLKQIFANAVSATKQNQLTWETNRTVDANGNPVNGTGTQLVISNFHTSDGAGGTNTYGIQTQLNIDVAQTKVVKKTSGADANGVVGNKGDEKIMDPTLTAGYKYVTNPTSTDIAHRPLGFAVRAHTQFKEFDIGSVQLVHPTGGASTLLYGVSMQNVNLKADLTATPIQ